MHIACMATKTISLKTEAYNRLRDARRYPDESFSEVVLRATWPEDTVSAGAFLNLIRSSRVPLTEDEWARVDAAKRADQAPEDKWSAR